MQTLKHPIPTLFALAASALAITSAHAADTLVNIKGFGSDGSGVTQAYNYPLAPGSTISMTNPVLVDMKAGDYLVSDAWGEPGALYDAWNYNLNQSGTWDSHFYVAVQQGTSASYTLLLDGLSLRDPSCANANCSWNTEAEASQAFLQTAPMGLHIAQDEVVAFSSTDYYLADNAGGMSLQISAAVPEPAEWLLLLVALPALAVGGWKEPVRPAASSARDVEGTRLQPDLGDLSLGAADGPETGSLSRTQSDQ